MIAEKVIFVTLFALAGVVLGTDPFTCSKGINTLCGQPNGFVYKQQPEAEKCKGEWGAFPRINLETSQLIKDHLSASTDYLFISNHFQDWMNQRPGFVNYFQKLSDEKWEQAMALLVHYAERGGTLSVDNFNFTVPIKVMENEKTHKLGEMEAMSYALDRESWLAQRTLHLAHSAIHGKSKKSNSTDPAATTTAATTTALTSSEIAHDPEFAEFLSEGLRKKTVLRIKHLANYVNLLANIMQMQEDKKAYALFKFDTEYLK